MTPLDIMEALRDVPEDLIDIDYENLFASNPAEQVPHRTETGTIHMNSFPAEQAGTDEPENPKRMRGSAVLSYLMTACCTAACIGGIAVLLCMTKLSGNYSVQPQDATQLQPSATVTATVSFPNTATTASVLYTEILPVIQNTAQPYSEKEAVSTTYSVMQTTALPVTTGSTTVTAAQATAPVTEKTPELLQISRKNSFQQA